MKFWIEIWKKFITQKINLLLHRTEAFINAFIYSYLHFIVRLMSDPQSLPKEFPTECNPQFPHSVPRILLILHPKAANVFFHVFLHFQTSFNISLNNVF